VTDHGRRIKTHLGCPPGWEIGETYLQTPLPEDLTGQVIEELGRGFVANGESNQVWLRCSRSVDGAATCKVDLGRGFGWEPLAVDR